MNEEESVYERMHKWLSDRIADPEHAMDSCSGPEWVHHSKVLGPYKACLEMLESLKI